MKHTFAGCVLKKPVEMIGTRQLIKVRLAQLLCKLVNVNAQFPVYRIVRLKP